VTKRDDLGLRRALVVTNRVAATSRQLRKRSVLTHAAVRDRASIRRQFSRLFEIRCKEIYSRRCWAAMVHVHLVSTDQARLCVCGEYCIKQLSEFYPNEVDRQ
jgi:hypothetical protein